LKDRGSSGLPDTVTGRFPVVVAGAHRMRAAVEAWRARGDALLYPPRRIAEEKLAALVDAAHSSAAVHALAEYVREEVLALVDAGVTYLQVDEPAFVTRHDQPAELDVAVAAMGRVLDGLPSEVLVITHMCYGSFHEVHPRMLDLPATVFCLELSHVSDELLDLLRRHPLPPDRVMGFGVVDAMDPRVESVEEIERRIRQALAYLPPEQLWLNPDCGLQTLPRAAAIGKMRNLTEAARNVRAELR
jgi:5-methyltetrahydropteroyltriglutamate--homocysteine methyltransferase